MYAERTLVLVSTLLWQSAIALAPSCPTVEIPPLPTKVSQLHPGHVTLVMAMGDSITAGFAASGVSLYESREISWSIGEGRTSGQYGTTLPLLLGAFTNQTVTGHSLEGASTKEVLPKDVTKLPHDDYHPATDHLNVAESEGAVLLGSLAEQWTFLTKALAQYADAAKRWKVLTLFMVANDSCDQCDAPVSDAFLQEWTNRTRHLFDSVAAHPNLTRTYINVVPLLNLSSVARVQRESVWCRIKHAVIKECGCITPKATSQQLAQVDANVHTLNSQLHALVAEQMGKLRASGRQDLAFVVQPFLEGAGSRLDLPFLSSLDCFHPSESAHSDLAVGLWNSMLCHERPTLCGAGGATFPQPNLTATCPSSSSIFYTGVSDTF